MRLGFAGLIRGYSAGRLLLCGGWLGILLAVGGLFAWDDVAAAALMPGAMADDGIQVVAADVSGIVLEVSLAQPVFEPVVGPDGQAYTQVALPGFESAGQSGHPMLPARNLLLAVPPGAQLRLTTVVLAEQASVAPAPLYPAAGWTYDEDAAGNGAPRAIFGRDAAAYASTDLIPAAPATVEEAGIMRGVRLARITLTPLQYRPATQALRFVQRMRVEVQFVGDVAATASAAAPDVAGFTELLRETVINPEYVAAWPRNDAPVSTAAGVPSAVGGLPLERTRYRVTLRETGIYRLTYDDLVAAGLPVETLDPRLLSMYRGDDELAIEVLGEGDGRFDAGDEVRFYAERVQSLYTEINTLWLAVGDAPGRRMATRDVAPTGGTTAPSFPDTRHFEVNRIYRSNMPMASDVDHWYWGQMFAVGAARSLTMTLPFTITHPLPAGAATLTLELWGASSDFRVNPDHHVRAFINGTAIGDIRWDGAVRLLTQLTFDQALLRPGGNTLALYTPADTGARDAFDRVWEVNWLNYFRVTYDRDFMVTDDALMFTPVPGPTRFAIGGWSTAKVAAYDVTDPLAPVRLEGAVMFGAAGSYVLRLTDTVAPGGRYVVSAPGRLLAPLAVAADAPSGLRAATEGADYLLIAHADFVAGVQPLAEFRRSQGLRVRVVDVQDVYDEFSGGLLDPHAIRAFIRYAYFNWPGPPPSYVVLVGDGTYDLMDREGYGAKTFVPPFLAAVDPIMGETAADNRYVAVDGDDIFPDLHLGRLPVNNQAELAAVVDKLVAYEAAPAAGDWRNRAVFVADNADAAGQFAMLSDAVVAYVPPEFTVQRIYLGTAEYPTSEAARAQQATLDAFNTGALLFNYVGHSSVSSWAAELLFGLTALPQVNNGNRLPIMLPMTCLEGTYHNPRYAGLAESVVRLAGRGAVASWSPTGQGVASGHDYLHRGFYDALFNWDVRVLGEATTAGLLNLYTNARFADGTPLFRDLVDTYVLLGDPATRIGVAPANLSLTATGTPGPLMAGDTVTYTVRYTNTSAARVKGVVIVADLPLGLNDIAWRATGPALTWRPGTRLAWDLAQLAPSEAGEIVITGRVPDALPAGSLPFAAAMRISSRWTETDLADNRAGPLVTTLVPADLMLVQFIEPVAAVAMGDLVTFTLSYANLGQAVATGVTLTLLLPVPLDDLRVLQSGPIATLRPGSHYVWDIAPVPAGAKGRLTVSGRVPHTLTWAQLSWSVAAYIGTTWPDAVPGNNAAAAGAVLIEAGDAFEPDDTPAQASRLTSLPALQPHAYDTVGDQDWVVFRAQAGMHYLIRTQRLGAGGDTVLFLRDDAGNLLAKNDDAAPDTRASRIVWRAAAAQDYYITVTSNNPFAGFFYQLQVLELPYSTALPLIQGSGAGQQ